MANIRAFSPDWVSPPGRTISALLSQKQLGADALAQRLGMASSAFRDLISGVEKIDANIANRLSDALGGTVDFWVRREANYREQLSNMAAEVESKQIDKLMHDLPYKEMADLGWVRTATSNVERVLSVLQFFGSTNAASVEKQVNNIAKSTRLRTSRKFASTAWALAAWVRQGMIAASETTCTEWDAKRFKLALPSIRTLTRQKDPEIFLKELQDLCSSCGVAVVALKAPKMCKASGATVPLPRNRKLILLSFRHRTDDHFWFTFFHEAGHLLLHDSRASFVDSDYTESGSCETEADEFSAQVLLPDVWRKRMKRVPLDAKEIMRFAKDAGVSPGIVVGQLQHEGAIRMNQFNFLKRRFIWMYD